MKRKYTFEVYDKHGTLLADTSAFTANRSVVLSRNRPDRITFTLDLDKYEEYCRTSRIDSRLLLTTFSSEIRVRRREKYIAGGQLSYKKSILRSQNSSIECRVDGYLALFAKRHTGETPSGTVLEIHTSDYGTAKSRKDLAWYLIDASQQLTNGDFGISRGTAGGSTTLYDKTYSRSNILDALINMTELQTEPIDIEVTPEKVFKTYEHIGSNRPDIVFEYPGNIIGFEAPDDATDLTNEVIGQGAGSNDGTQIQYFADDLVSQSDRQLRQDVLQTNATDNSDNGLTDAAEARLAAKSTPMDIPAFTVNGNVAPTVTDYGIGDRVTVKVNKYPSLSHINGTYRIERITIDLDEEDNETVRLEVSEV
ncbi:hypothetical protein AB0H71_28850 [Nocardia sp. NPDC050697]|uniref:hypothetical protein n=1 Tax=Nocardia sp. NPDC050697 TaxID=3155158 RepID=UPI0033F6B666